MFGQGDYYPGPVTPAGTLDYSSTTISFSPSLQFLQGRLGSLYPGVGLATPPTTAQYSAAVTSCVVDIQNGLENGTGVTLTSFSTDAVTFNAAGIVTTSTAIAQGIVQVDFTVNNNPAQAATDLTNVATALATAQPTQVGNMLQGLLAPATSGTSAALLAPSVSQIVNGAVAQLSGSVSNIAAAVNAGKAAVIGANVPAMQKTTLYNGYITSLLSSPAANNAPSVISAMVAALSAQNVQTVSNLQTILNTRPSRRFLRKINL